MALLAYLDGIISLNVDCIKTLEQTLALATIKTLSIIDLSRNCGMLGIGIAQLIPSCNVVVLDSPRASETLKSNIEIAYPAISSTVEFRDWDTDSLRMSANGGKTVDIVFVTELEGTARESPIVAKVLKVLLLQYARLVVIVVEQSSPGGDSPVKDLLSKSGCSPLDTVLFPAPETSNQRYRIAVFQGKSREPRFRDKALSDSYVT